MKKTFLFLLIILLTSCSTLTKTQRMERDMFDPKRKGSELKQQKSHEKQSEQNKKWTQTPKRK